MIGRIWRRTPPVMRFAAIAAVVIEIVSGVAWFVRRRATRSAAA